MIVTSNGPTGAGSRAPVSMLYAGSSAVFGVRSGPTFSRISAFGAVSSATGTPTTLLAPGWYTCPARTFLAKIIHVYRRSRRRENGSGAKGVPFVGLRLGKPPTGI